MKKETVMDNNHSINIYNLQPLISQTTTYNHLSHKQQLTPLISQTATYNYLSHKQQLTTTYLTSNNLQPLISQTTTYNHLSHKQQLTTTYLTNKMNTKRRRYMTSEIKAPKCIIFNHRIHSTNIVIICSFLILCIVPLYCIVF